MVGRLAERSHGLQHQSRKSQDEKKAESDNQRMKSEFRHRRNCSLKRWALPLRGPLTAGFVG